jgi:hypothetical protein
MKRKLTEAQKKVAVERRLRCMYSTLGDMAKQHVRQKHDREFWQQHNKEFTKLRAEAERSLWKEYASDSESESAESESA